MLKDAIERRGAKALPTINNAIALGLCAFGPYFCDVSFRLCSSFIDRTVSYWRLRIRALVSSVTPFRPSLGSMLLMMEWRLS
jgi:hypothetical protein